MRDVSFFIFTFDVYLVSKLELILGDKFGNDEREWDYTEADDDAEDVLAVGKSWDTKECLAKLELTCRDHQALDDALYQEHEPENWIWQNSSEVKINSEFAVDLVAQVYDDERIENDGV